QQLTTLTKAVKELLVHDLLMPGELLHGLRQCREGAHRASEDHGRGADEADRPGSDLAALREHVAADRGRREQAERDREHAQRVREESRREEAERRLAEFGRRGAEESRGYGLGD